MNDYRECPKCGVSKPAHEVLRIVDGYYQAVPCRTCSPKPVIVAVDFDGTCVLHEYPKVGPDVPGAVEALKNLQGRGWKIILWSIRSGDELGDAVRWFGDRGIELWGINQNPTQNFWSKSPKAYAVHYIDDAAIGCPLIPGRNGGRDYVDWEKVMALLPICEAQS